MMSAPNKCSLLSYQDINWFFDKDEDQITDLFFDDKRLYSVGYISHCNKKTHTAINFF